MPGPTECVYCARSRCVRFRLSGYFVNGAVSRNKQKCAGCCFCCFFLFARLVTGPNRRHPHFHSVLPRLLLLCFPLDEPETRYSFSSQLPLLRRPFFFFFFRNVCNLTYISRRSMITTIDKNFHFLELITRDCFASLPL